MPTHDAGDDTPCRAELRANLSNALQGTFQIISAEQIKLHFYSAIQLHAKIIEAGDSWRAPACRHNKPTRADNSQRTDSTSSLSSERKSDPD